MKIFDAFPSKYLKASDLHDRQVQAVMQHVMMEDIGETDPKPILYFQGVPKGLVLNKTNAKVIALGYGQETEGWRDMPLILFPCMVDFRGESVEAIRVKLLSARQGGPKKAEGRQAFIRTSADPDATAAQMGEDWAAKEAASLIRASQHVPRASTPEEWERAEKNFLSRGRAAKPTTIPAHEVVWDDTGERVPTAEERIELRTSLQRANAALDERRASRGAAEPDGLDIPEALRRIKPDQFAPHDPSYNWIEHMQDAAE